MHLKTQVQSLKSKVCKVFINKQLHRLIIIKINNKLKKYGKNFRHRSRHYQ